MDLQRSIFRNRRDIVTESFSVSGAIEEARKEVEDDVLLSGEKFKYGFQLLKGTNGAKFVEMSVDLFPSEKNVIYKATAETNLTPLLKEAKALLKKYDADFKNMLKKNGIKR